MFFKVICGLKRAGKRPHSASRCHVVCRPPPADMVAPQYVCSGQDPSSPSLLLSSLLHGLRSVGFGHRPLRNQGTLSLGAGSPWTCDSWNTTLQVPTMIEDVVQFACLIGGTPTVRGPARDSVAKRSAMTTGTALGP
jgi:hypothetical protein